VCSRQPRTQWSRSPGERTQWRRSHWRQNQILTIGCSTSTGGGDSSHARSSLSGFFDPEGEYIASRQDQRTLGEYADREDAGDVFEADNRMRWFTFVTNVDVDEK